MFDGILPGFFGYEAGQAGGRGHARLVRGAAFSAGERNSKSRTRADGGGEARARASTGLVALDWWNGNRTILGDADLSGVIAGLTLATTPAEIYRALLESVAFGTAGSSRTSSSTGCPSARSSPAAGSPRAARS